MTTPTRSEVAARLAQGHGTLTGAEVGVLLGSTATRPDKLRAVAARAARQHVIPPPVQGLDGNSRGWVWTVPAMLRWEQGDWPWQTQRPTLHVVTDQEAS